MRSIVLLTVVVVTITTILRTDAYSESQNLSIMTQQGNAIVNIKSMPVLSKQGKNGVVILTIDKGKIVFVKWKLSTGDGSWCAISQKATENMIGYVNCDYLQFKEWSQSNYKEHLEPPVNSIETQHTKTSKKLPAKIRPKIKQNKNWPALLDAAWQGKPDTIRALLKGGVDVNIKDKQSGLTALMAAAVFGKTEAVDLLISAGAKINAIENYGWSALMIASDGGNLSTVKALLSGGANINIKEGNGFTALDLAEKKGHANIVKLLRNTEEIKSRK